MRDIDRGSIVVRCEIPTLAARAIRIESVAKRARAVGLIRARLRHTTMGPADLNTRIITRVSVARFLVDECRAAAIASARGSGPAKRAVAIACGKAAATLSHAIDQAIEGALQPTAAEAVVARPVSTPRAHQTRV